MSILLPSWKYNFVHKTWVNFVPELIPSILFPANTIKFITYNVWFEKFNFKERMEELNEIFEKSDADFICLQEVTQLFLVDLMNRNYIKEKYFVSFKTKMNWYDTIILSKYPCSLYYISFPTEMERSLLYILIDIVGKKFAVATSHFESLYNANYRKAQLEIAFKELNQYDFACLMGDFNFDNKLEEENLSSNFDDLWKILYDIKENPGYTMPSNEKFCAWRPDKFLLKKNLNIKGKSIQIIGNLPIKKYLNQNIPKNFVCTPSDHYGLEIVLEFI